MRSSSGDRFNSLEHLEQYLGAILVDKIEDDTRNALTAHIQEPPFLFLQNKASQPAGCKRPGVNSDSIETNFWDVRRCVTVHDKHAVLRLAGQERLANIQKIIAILAIEGYAWPYSGMAEEVIADDRRTLERF